MVQFFAVLATSSFMTTTWSVLLGHNVWRSRHHLVRCVLLILTVDEVMNNYLYSRHFEIIAVLLYMVSHSLY